MVLTIDQIEARARKLAETLPPQDGMVIEMLLMEIEVLRDSILKAGGQIVEGQQTLLGALDFQVHKELPEGAKGETCETSGRPSADPSA